MFFVGWSFIFLTTEIYMMQKGKNITNMKLVARQKKSKKARYIRYLAITKVYLVLDSLSFYFTMKIMIQLISVSLNVNKISSNSVQSYKIWETMKTPERQCHSQQNKRLCHIYLLCHQHYWRVQWIQVFLSVPPPIIRLSIYQSVHLSKSIHPFAFNMVFSGFSLRLSDFFACS